MSSDESVIAVDAAEPDSVDAAEPDDADPAAPGAALGPDGEHAVTDPDTEAVTDPDSELSQVRSQLTELTGDLQRLQAEYVNYKRRVDRDRELVKENSRFAVLSAFLPVLDDIDRARDHGELEGGFKAVADAVDRVVTGMGVTKFGRPGDEFDPNRHQALMHSHSAEVSTTTCQSIVAAGYSIGQRVVRPAQVTVVDPEPERMSAEPEPDADD